MCRDELRRQFLGRQQGVNMVDTWDRAWEASERKAKIAACVAVASVMQSHGDDSCKARCDCQQCRVVAAIHGYKIDTRPAPPEGFTYDRRGGLRRIGVYDG